MDHSESKIGFHKQRKWFQGIVEEQCVIKDNSQIGYKQQSSSLYLILKETEYKLILHRLINLYEKWHIYSDSDSFI